MKKYLLLLLLVVAGAELASADTPLRTSGDEVTVPYEEQTFWQKFTNPNIPNLQTHHEIRIGMGYPYIDHFDDMRNNHLSGGLFDDYANSREEAGAINQLNLPYVRYMKRWGDRFEWGAGGMFVYRQQNLYNTVTSEIINTQRVHSMMLMPELRYNVVRWKLFRLHVSLGATCVMSFTPNSATLSSEIYVGWGYTIGGKLFFFHEGVASDYTFNGLWGIGYRF